MENFYKPKIIKYIRSYRVRLLPTKEQEELLIKMNGTCRFIWNMCLEYCIMHYDNKLKYYNYRKIKNNINEFNKLLTYIKKFDEYKWLNEVSRHSLGLKMNDLKNAYEKFFLYQKDNKFYYDITINKHKQKWHPQFKSKKNDNDISIPFDADEVYYNNQKIHFPKVGWINIQTDIDIPIGSAIGRHNYKIHKNYILNPRIKFINNKWILCFAMECENQAPILNNKEIVGIDLGLKDLCAVTHYDDDNCIIYHNINKVNARIKSLDKRLNNLQRKLSCKYRTFKRLYPNQKFKRCKSFNLLRKKIRKVYYQLTNIRKNYLHYVSKNIISRLPRAIVLKDLNLNFMIKNHKQAKSESNQMLGAFRNMICYKAQEKGIEIIWAPKNYPSSKMCSNCYNIKKELKLSERIYKCDVCGFEINRDINAAINLEKYGIFNAYAFTLNECNKC